MENVHVTELGSREGLGEKMKRFSYHWLTKFTIPPILWNISISMV